MTCLTWLLNGTTKWDGFDLPGGKKYQSFRKLVIFLGVRQPGVAYKRKSWTAGQVCPGDSYCMKCAHPPLLKRVVMSSFQLFSREKVFHAEQQNMSISGEVGKSVLNPLGKYTSQMQLKYNIICNWFSLWTALKCRCRICWVRCRYVSGSNWCQTADLPDSWVRLS